MLTALVLSLVPLAGPAFPPAAAPPDIVTVARRARADDDGAEPVEDAGPVVRGSAAGTGAMAAGAGITGVAGVVALLVLGATGCVVGCCQFTSLSPCGWGALALAVGPGAAAGTALVAVATFVAGPAMGLSGWLASVAGGRRPSPWPLVAAGWAGASLTAVTALVVGCVPAGLAAVLGYQQFASSRVATSAASRTVTTASPTEMFIILPMLGAALLAPVVVTVLGLGATAVSIGVVAGLGLGTPAPRAARADEGEEDEEDRVPRRRRKPVKRTAPVPEAPDEDRPSLPPEPVVPAQPILPDADVVRPGPAPGEAPPPSETPPRGPY